MARITDKALTLLPVEHNTMASGKMTSSTDKALTLLPLETNTLASIQDGKYHGPGTYTYAKNGTEQTGFFLNGSFVPYLCQEMGLTRGTDAYGQCGY